MTIAVGDRVPDASFPHIAYTPELDDLSVCGVISTYAIAKEWAGKKVVVFTVPGAFTPTCHVNHLPGYLKNHALLTEKGVDVVAVIAVNDPFVMSAWARVEGLKDKIVALSDADAAWVKSLGLSIDMSAHKFGTRAVRCAMVLEDLVVKHLKIEQSPGSLEVSGAEHILALL